MLNFYPFGSGSLYTASFAISSSHSPVANFITYVTTASNATTILEPRSGSAGTSVCLITYEQYQSLISSSTLIELCSNIPS